MANKDLFAQAIADAKKLKEISMANAKQAIEEAFAPRIQEMFRMKLSEMEETNEEVLEEDDDIDNMEDEGRALVNEKKPHDEEGINEMTLEEILAELELEEGVDTLEETYDESTDPMEEAKGDDEEDDDMEDVADDEETPAEGGENEKVDIDVVTDMEGLKDALRDVIMQILPDLTGQGAQPTGDLEGGGMESGDGGDATINLEEILAELEMEEANVPRYEGGKQNPELEEARKKKMADKKKEDEKEEAKELNEAIKTINTLKSQLNEINLLNAKLLYVNKLFKSKSLSESQKVKVIAAFDRATTITETKNIYVTLSDSLTTQSAGKKAPLKESLGFASKPIGSAPASPIVEADAYVLRMQQLAGLRQPNI